MPAVAGHDGGLAGEESDHVVGIRLVGAETETNRAAQAAHRLVGERVLLPVSAWTSSSVLAWKIAIPPLGAVVCKPAFVGARVHATEVEVVGEQIDDGR